MKFKNMKKVIAVGMFASLVIGVVPAMPASAEGSLFEPQFVPVPKNVTLVDEMLTFTSSVNIHLMCTIESNLIQTILMRPWSSVETFDGSSCCHLTLVDEMLTFTSSVNIKGEDVADQDAVKSLKAFLSEN